MKSDMDDILKLRDTLKRRASNLTFLRNYEENT